jgi:hypothetical protein
MASIPLTNSAMAHLPSNKPPMLIYQTQTNFTSYLPLVVSPTLPHRFYPRKRLLCPQWQISNNLALFSAFKPNSIDKKN